MTPEYIESLRGKLAGRNRAACARESGISRSWLDKFVYGLLAGNFRIDTIRKLELWFETHPKDTPRFQKTKNVAQEKKQEPAGEVPGGVQGVQDINLGMGSVPREV